MEENKSTYKNIDEYIALFTPEVQEKLKEMRTLIHETAPEATEKISWQMPTFFLHGNLVHFAAFKKHIGFYPGADGVACFTDELTDYSYSKGAIQFPLTKPIPADLVRKIIRFRMEQNLRDFEEKSQKSKK